MIVAELQFSVVSLKVGGFVCLSMAQGEVGMQMQSACVDPVNVLFHP